MIRNNRENYLTIDITRFVENGVLKIKRKNFLSSVTKIKFLDPENLVKEIGISFLRGCNYLTHVDLSELNQVTTIGHGFFYGCSNLEHIDLSMLNKVKNIGPCFFYGCSSLTSIDLSPLKNITKIRWNFLRGCSSLTNINFDMLNNVVSIENNFLHECRSLINIDLFSFTGVTSIENNFLSKCSGLISIDLSSSTNIPLEEFIDTGIPFEYVTTIPSKFLCECSSLTSIDLSSMVNVTSIPVDFLIDLEYLTSIYLPSFVNVTTIPSGFLSGCRGLTSIDLSSFVNVTTIGESFLNGCCGLTSIDLSSFVNVTTIGESFLNKCSSLTSIDLSSFTNVTTILGNFLYECSGLTYIDLTPLENVYRIKTPFLGGCRSLENINVYVALPPPPEIIEEVSYFNKAIAYVKKFIERFTLTETEDEVVFNKTFVKKIVNIFRESNDEHIQMLGNNLYIKYLLKIPRHMKTQLNKINICTLVDISPEQLEDIIQISDEQVIDYFKQQPFWKNTGPIVDKENLQRVLEYLFVDSSITISWVFYQDKSNNKETKICFKHIIKHLCSNKTNKDECLTYIIMLVEGFRNCQTRQAMTLNIVLACLGVLKHTGGKYSVVYDIVNNIKNSEFERLIRDKFGIEAGVHEYSRHFTVIKNRFGLPSAMKGFDETISRISEEEALQIMSEYLSYFNYESIVKMFLFEANVSIKDESKINGYSFRVLMGETSEFNDDFFENIRHTMGISETTFDFVTSDLNEKEATYLLKKLEILN